MQNQVVRRKQQHGGYRPDLEEGGSKWLLWRRHREEAVLRDNERKVPFQKRELFVILTTWVSKRFDKEGFLLRH